jgi:peptide/nickel transport system permease protein
VTRATTTARRPAPRTRAGRVLRAVLERREATAAAAVVLALLAVAAGADLLASSHPIAARYHGELHLFPNLRDVPALTDLDNADLCATLEPGDWALLPPVPYGPHESRVGGRVRPLEPPGRGHWLGTDDRGRDVLARLIHGSRVSLTVGVCAVLIYAVLGVLLGASAGYYGGGVDRAINRAIETMMAFPAFFFILAVQGLMGSSSLLQLIVVIGLTRWTDVARLVRAEVLRLRDAEFVLAARATGLRESQILLRHVLPNATGPVWVSCTFGIAAAVLTESALSFLGFGTPPPTASWGGLLTQAYENPQAWWLTVFPGLAVFATVTAYNVLGEVVRDVIDPRLGHTLT